VYYLRVWRDFMSATRMSQFDYRPTISSMGRRQCWRDELSTHNEIVTTKFDY